MDYKEQSEYCCMILKSLGLPKKYCKETLDMYATFRNENRKCVAHYDQRNFIRVCVLFIARKNNDYVLSSEIFERPSAASKESKEYQKNNREIRSIYRKLKEHFKNPAYLNFSTGKYLDRICKVLDLSHRDIESVLSSLEANETPVSILQKLHKHLELDFDEITKAKPNISPAFFADGKD
jgi:hypothetical protein